MTDLFLSFFRNGTVSFQPPSIFKISFYYYTFFGAIMTIVFGLIISYMSKSASVDRKVLSPLIYRYLPDEGREEERVSCTGAQETSLNLG